ncbi:MAG: hypothetical protein KME16_23395 [Scytolyngbya sp. HA4215-MV1]|nr:hypothetical protein [Scytolyngbya sp. HA4215-MV1]
MDAILERARELKQALTDFVFDAEGDLATALESYAAKQTSYFPNQDSQQSQRVVDAFLTEGRVGTHTPLDLFIASHPDLSQDDRTLLQSWQRAFTGLFAVDAILPDSFELTNWLTAKRYTVKPSEPKMWEEMQRSKLGEILLTRIAPVTPEYWLISGPHTRMGNLGKPKLAVAIGNFKQTYKSQLYGDAPELLEQAWQSVEKYYQDFLDFFGGDEVTLSGYQLGKKLAEFQKILSKKQLTEAGIDDSKSLSELVESAGIDAAELEAAAESLGADAKAVSQIMKRKEALNQMVTPQVDLPPELKKAEQVTVLAHPRWGQMFLPAYTQFKQLLEAEDWQSLSGVSRLVDRNLQDPAMNAFVWHRLAAQYPKQLEQVLRTALEHIDFSLDRDLDQLLQTHQKPLEPELPEIASVPLHLHELFQSAIAEVSKSKGKSKESQKTSKKGFQRNS